MIIKLAGDHSLTPLEFDLAVSQWLMAQQNPTNRQDSNQISKIVIRHAGPSAVTDEWIRSNLGTKVDRPLAPADVDSDIRNLYATGRFFNVRVAQERQPDGVVLAYIVQEKPLLTQISFKGNTKVEDRVLRDTIVSAVDQPLDERKLFKDAERIQELYHQRGFTNAVVKYKTTLDEKAGRGTVAFEVLERQ